MVMIMMVMMRMMATTLHDDDDDDHDGDDDVDDDGSERLQMVTTDVVIFVHSRCSLSKFLKTCTSASGRFVEMSMSPSHQTSHSACRTIRHECRDCMRYRHGCGLMRQRFGCLTDRASARAFKIFQLCSPRSVAVPASKPQMWPPCVSKQRNERIETTQ